MSPDSATNVDEPIPTEVAVRLRAADYLWGPLYAKLWWAAILIYWLPAGGLLKVDWLTDFYSSASAAYLNILFLPLTAFVVLGFAYARRWLDDAEWVTSEDVPLDSTILDGRVGRPHWSVDPLDPRSGSNWIGISENQKSFVAGRLSD
jgi:hypothetical protein